MSCLSICPVKLKLLSIHVVRPSPSKTWGQERVRREEEVTSSGAPDSTNCVGGPARNSNTPLHECRPLIGLTTLRVGWAQRILWEGGTRCSRDTWPESYITKYTSIRLCDDKNIQVDEEEKKVTSSGAPASTNCVGGPSRNLNYCLAYKYIYIYLYIYI